MAHGERFKVQASSLRARAKQSSAAMMDALHWIASLALAMTGDLI
jgi:hypothetical protein